ncbi:MAG TPA: hypothetical protein VN634_11750 [Candidatus Limnocylindrales bacterium]|nr:hypothetical protein [Candidatus Limnocylindrales bacterium]
MSSPRTARIFALLLLLTAGQARAAGIADHQQCFKIKDPQTKATYSVDLIPGDNAFPSATGCQVKVPAKLLCIDVEKTNVSPVPPGADPGPAVQKSLCYKVKCPKITPTVVVEDQFGSRSVTVNGSSYLCAPVPVPSTTTTTLPGSCTTDGDCDPVTNGQAVCSAGTCVVGSCNPGYGNCNGLVADGCEVTLDSNPANCGSCGTICTAANGTAGCTSSTCTIGSCSAGFTDCNNSVVDGCEAATTSDPNNCGGCGTTCAAPNGTPGCTSGTCTISGCNSGFANCNGIPGDGCEVGTSSDTNNCGGCGLTCAAANGTAGCSSGSCTITGCNSGFANCNGNPADGCETITSNNPSNCGLCGVVCGGGTPNCSSGTCVP